MSTWTLDEIGFAPAGHDTERLRLLTLDERYELFRVLRTVAEEGGPVAQEASPAGAGDRRAGPGGEPARRRSRGRARAGVGTVGRGSRREGPGPAAFPAGAAPVQACLVQPTSRGGRLAPWVSEAALSADAAGDLAELDVLFLGGAA
ncbi:DUF6417 family protein [Streptomyces sp. NPDC096132]|uniref:DUF6417 family protein n=1 Tax=Streptomyces sp. NPDC096132 TaxID=3366075 RepID=UPI00382D8812